MTLDINTPRIQPYSIKLTEVETKDSWWPWKKDENNTIANFVAQPNFPYYDKNGTVGGVMLQMSFDVNVVQR